MSGGFSPKVANPFGFRTQTQSGASQMPFFFGGSQVPTDLFLARKSFSGSGLSPQIFQAKKGTEVIRRGTTVIPRHLPFS